MTDNEQKRIFSVNLTNILSERNLTQLEVANAIGVSHQTFNTWFKGKAIPRMDKIQLLADYFHIKMSDLIEKPAAFSVTSSPAADLRPDEKDLLSYYNLLDSEDRAEARGYVKGLMQSEKYRTDFVKEVG